MQKKTPRAGPKLTEVPPNLPLSYPKELKARTQLIIGKALRTFPGQAQILEMCKQVISGLTPSFLGAIRNNELPGRIAESRMAELLRCLLAHNCRSKSFRYERELRRSHEWLKLLREIARAEQSAKKRYSTHRAGA
jgi:hypothetical protein